jgi:hypothetical protein
MNINAFKKNTLYQTTEYQAFEMHVHNRDIHKTKELESSMIRHGYIPAYPLHVKRTKHGFAIKAGHHRFHVASLLKIPIWFVITEDEADITDLENATNTWSSGDFIDSIVRGGNKDYEMLKCFKEKTGMSISNCASLLAGQSASSGNAVSSIRYQTFEVKDVHFARRVADMILWLHACGIKHAKKSNFVGAISKVMRVEEFNDTQFKERVLTNLSEMKNCATEKQFIENISEVYNLRSRIKIPLVFLAQEKMTARNAAIQNKAK